MMPSSLPRSEQDGSGYQTIEEHEERAETEAADAPHSGDKTKQDDGGMPHILGKPAYRNGHNCSNEDQCIEDGKEIVTYATHHTQKITQGNKEKRAPCCLQCPLACGSEGWHTPPQTESKRKHRTIKAMRSCRRRFSALNDFILRGIGLVMLPSFLSLGIGQTSLSSALA